MTPQLDRVKRAIKLKRPALERMVREHIVTEAEIARLQQCQRERADRITRVNEELTQLERIRDELLHRRNSLIDSG